MTALLVAVGLLAGLVLVGHEGRVRLAWGIAVAALVAWWALVFLACYLGLSWAIETAVRAVTG